MVFWMDNGMLQFRSEPVYRILPVQFLTRVLTECVPAVDLLVVLLKIMVTFSKL